MLKEYNVAALKGLCVLLMALLCLQLFQNGIRTTPMPSIGIAALASAGSSAENSARTNSNPIPGAGTGVPLSNTVKARVDQITSSELLGPVIRPIPMALLGIAGKDVFVRAPNGQTGLLRIGEELGGLKLLQVGTNRILVEHEGVRKELTIFSGFGSPPLMPSSTPARSVR